MARGGSRRRVHVEVGSLWKPKKARGTTAGPPFEIVAELGKDYYEILDESDRKRVVKRDTILSSYRRVEKAPPEPEPPKEQKKEAPSEAVRLRADVCRLENKIDLLTKKVDRLLSSLGESPS